VRVEPSSLRNVSNAFESLIERAGIEESMEAYIYDEPSINAFVTRGREHTFIVLSSAAVNKLTEIELEFLIGHEFGHAIFGHMDFPAEFLIQTGRFDARRRMQMLAWQRAAEISADRCGLICCGSLDAAATAMFKTLSGLGGSDIRVLPSDFAEQWDHLADEVVSGGADEHWEMTHPFPPLRMQAMMVFWSGPGGASDSGEDDIAALGGDPEKAVARLLAMMDPLAREDAEAADPVLVNFLFWGGLYIALANGRLGDEERREIASLAPARRLEELLGETTPSTAACLERFEDCLAGWGRKLTALEIHRIMQGLLLVSFADGEIDEDEKHAFTLLGEKLGVAAHACDLLASRYMKTRGIE
jgi:hypothetical protein